ncbi:MAG: radical SAM protein [Candidatus Zixiibacteriota bacterium]|nr:MAG: radical SAM protein [candidate division Zixibacteria bacterium]
MASERKRVALVSARVEPRQHIPINLLVLAACIEDRAEVRVFDPEYDDQELKDVKDFQPDIIGFTSFTQNYHRAREIAANLKSEFGSRATYIMGGVHATVKPQETFREMGVDMLFVGEGEQAIRDVVDGKPPEQIGGAYIGNGMPTPPELIQDLDTVPLPAYHLMPDFEKYLIPPGTIRGTWQKRGTVALMSSRGCPFSCIFCGSHVMFGRKVRHRSVDNVIDEVRVLHEQWGVRSIWFADDTFTVNKKWVIEFCEKVQPFGLQWGCQVRADTINDEVAKALRAAGCSQADIGIESGSDLMLTNLKKSSSREKIIRCCEILKRHKIRRMATFVLGTPGESYDDIEQTKSLLRIVKPEFSIFFYLTPYPGTELYEMCEENNWFIDKDYIGLGSQEKPITSITFTPEEVSKIRDDLFKLVRFWNLRGYFTPATIWGLLTIMSPRGIGVFISRLWRTKNLYDAMFAFLQDYRYRRGMKIKPHLPS